MSPPEVRLWSLLRRSPCGIRFRRQHAVGPYVADFYCPAAKLVIEIDGLGHDFADRAARDAKRDDYIRSLGLSVIRIPAGQVLADSVAVADGLVALCAEAVGPSTAQSSLRGPPPHRRIRGDRED